MKTHHKDFMGIAVFFVMLFIGWILVGGPGKAKETGDAYNRFQEPLGPIQSGETYNDVNHAGQPFDVIPEDAIPE